MSAAQGEEQAQDAERQRHEAEQRSRATLAGLSFENDNDPNWDKVWAKAMEEKGAEATDWRKREQKQQALSNLIDSAGGGWHNTPRSNKIFEDSKRKLSKSTFHPFQEKERAATDVQSKQQGVHMPQRSVSHEPDSIMGNSSNGIRLTLSHPGPPALMRQTEVIQRRSLSDEAILRRFTKDGSQWTKAPQQPESIHRGMAPKDTLMRDIISLQRSQRQDASLSGMTSEVRRGDARFPHQKNAVSPGSKTGAIKAEGCQDAEHTVNSHMGFPTSLNCLRIKDVDNFLTVAQKSDTTSSDRFARLSDKNESFVYTNTTMGSPILEDVLSSSPDFSNRDYSLKLQERQRRKKQANSSDMETTCRKANLLRQQQAELAQKHAEKQLERAERQRSRVLLPIKLGLMVRSPEDTNVDTNLTCTSVLTADISKHSSVSVLPPHGLLEKGIAAASTRLFPALLKQVEGTSRRRHANASAYTPKLNSEGDENEIMQHLIDAELDSIYSDFCSDSDDDYTLVINSNSPFEGHHQDTPRFIHGANGRAMQRVPASPVEHRSSPSLHVHTSGFKQQSAGQLNVLCSQQTRSLKNRRRFDEERRKMLQEKALDYTPSTVRPQNSAEDCMPRTQTQI